MNLPANTESALPGLPDFEAADIDPAAFTHEAHVLMAWRLLREAELPTAILRYTDTLRRVTSKFGVEQKYHETVTWFFMITIAERRGRAPDDDWEEFKNRNPDLFRDARALLDASYSPARLESTLARKQFLLPDLTTTA